MANKQSKQETIDELLERRRNCKHDWEELVDRFLNSCYRKCNNCKKLEKLPTYKHGEEGTHFACKEMIEKLGNQVGCCGCNDHKCLDTKPDTGFTALDSIKPKPFDEEGFVKLANKITGDDSMKEQIEEILNYNFYEAWSGQKAEKNPEIAAKITALFQSQQKPLNIGFLRQWLNEDRITDSSKMVTNEEIEIMLGLEAEQKGQE